MKKTCFYLCNILIPLMIGAMLYCLLRPDAWISLRLYRLFSLGPATLPLPRWLLQILRCFGADILWSYALTFAVAWVLSESRPWQILAVSAGFSLLTECTQAFGWLRGTFDPLDILLQICITALGALIIKLHKSKEKRT